MNSVVFKVQPGAILDGFRIEELLHIGGMAKLWRVSHPEHAAPLLMKVPMMREGDDPAAIVSFEMEQMILPRLDGPHVPRFIASGDFSVQPYLVMERVAGTSLLSMLKRLPLPADELASLGARIANALADLHRQHVVHLDVKPSNILMREDGHIVLIDYGLARHMQLPDLMHEEFRLPYGTAPYMAPEQVLGNRSEFRSDQFALGALLYFFATGVRPFGDPQSLKGLKKRIWRDPDPPRKRRPDLPPALQEVILRCLDVNPANRYPNMTHLAADLTDPANVALTLRAQKIRRDRWLDTFRRRFDTQDFLHVKPQTAMQRLAQSPIVVVAIDLSEGSEALSQALRLTVRRLLDNAPQARVACVNVIKTHRIALDSSLDDAGRNKHAHRLAQLRQWAAPLGDIALTCHVFEAVSPADAILEYVHANPVDHVVMGARAASALRTLLGTVSGQVAAHAPCTVTVVRQRLAD
ncbi:bifunctional serine/threonine-protein kinase/universal stress protein [Xanthomonadaceae bacterium JHOS43]|nr:bifunctional serine/threonine-protein kinase/universal stress protein [Xanthomonadaceae bacterium JHOS43]MCX7564043.1 bifunctional serine/threonine-protein kinase/universal stress protein [Xanthomonadaceae bacterium XH05]